jgi:hypothetical protein
LLDRIPDRERAGARRGLSPLNLLQAPTLPWKIVALNMLGSIAFGASAVASLLEPASGQPVSAGRKCRHLAGRYLLPDRRAAPDARGRERGARAQREAAARKPERAGLKLNPGTADWVGTKWVLSDDMRDEGLLGGYAFAARHPATHSQPRLVLIAALLTALISGATYVGAILAPAPAVAIPLVVAICVGCPLFAGWEVPTALAALRANRAGQALARLRRSLDELPEIQHPLGF